MSRTMCRTLDRLRLGIGGAAAAVLLVACGGSGAGSEESPRAAEASDQGTTAAAGVDEFCSQAAGIDERVDSALSDIEGDPSLTDAFQEIEDDLRSIEAPAEIASDWNAMAEGLHRMVAAFGQVDITDVDSLEALDRAEGDLTTVSKNVDEYLHDECGI